MHRRHNLLYAVRKLTIEVTTLGSERVLPWYKGKGSRLEISHFSGAHRVTRTYTVWGTAWGPDLV